MRPVQWGEHTTYIHTDSAILNVNFIIHLSLLCLLQILLCLWWLVASLLPQRLGFYVRSLHVGFVIDKVAVRQVFLWVYPCHYHSTHAPYSFILLLVMLYDLNMLLLQYGMHLTLNLLTSTIVASSNARNANVYFPTTFVWQRWQPSPSIWLHNVSTLNQSWKQSCVIFVCKHLFSNQRDPN